MPFYYKGFSHVNTKDEEEIVVSITSTEEEKKRIDALLITKDVNQGIMTTYIEREKIIEDFRTGVITESNALVLDLDLDVPVGQTLKITLKNVVVGTNAEIYGAIKYELM